MGAISENGNNAIAESPLAQRVSTEMSNVNRA
jgi:hypothetical protein